MGNQSKQRKMRCLSLVGLLVLAASVAKGDLDQEVTMLDDMDGTLVRSYSSGFTSGGPANENSTLGESDEVRSYSSGFTSGSAAAAKVEEATSKAPHDMSGLPPLP